MTNPNVDWPDVFRQTIINNVKHWLAVVEGDDPANEVDMAQVYVALEYALQVPEAWSVAKTLLCLLDPQQAQQGFTEQWQALLLQAIARSREENDPIEIAMRLSVANLYRLQGAFGPAKACLEAGLAICPPEDERYWQILNQLAHVACLAEDYNQATDYSSQVLVNDELPPTVQAEAYNALGLVALNQHQWTEALTHFEQAITLYEDVSEPYQTARLLTNQGVALQNLNRLTEAKGSFEEAISNFQKAGNQVEIYKAIMNLGNIYEIERAYEAAIDQYQQALPIFERFSYQVDLGRTYNNLGVAYTGFGNFKLAEAYYQAAINVWAQLQSIYQWANTFDNLGLMHVEARQPEKARIAWQAGLNIIAKAASDNPAHQNLRQEIKEHLAELNKT